MAQWIAGIGTRHTFNEFYNALRGIGDFYGAVTMQTSVGYDSRPQVRFAFKPETDDEDETKECFKALCDQLGKPFVRKVELCISPEGRW